MQPLNKWSHSNIFKFSIAAIIFSLQAIAVYSQEKITGKVTGNDDLPLSGATVFIKGSRLGTVTDSSGSFSINGTKGDQLLFSFVAYETRVVTISSDLFLSVHLQNSVSNLNEVIVAGYVSEAVKDITGSVAIVKPKELTAVPAGQVESMLQGRVAGMNVITQATPGARTLISIHGYGNFGDVSPLYVVDGSPADINDLNPDDIQTVVVLKDAGSAAIYGVRGANGVVEVTTKKGRAGGTRINFVNYLGYQIPLKNGYDILNPQEMAELTWNAYKNIGQTPPNGQYGKGANPVLPDYVVAGNEGGLSEDDPATNKNLYNIDPAAGAIYQIVKANKYGTDVFHEIYSPAFSQNYNLDVSGGNEKNRYLFSAGYLDQQGTLTNTYLKRFTIRINTEFNLMNHFRMGENVQLSSRETPYYEDAFNPGLKASAHMLSNPILPLSDIKGNPYVLAPELGPPANIQRLDNLKLSKSNSWIVLGNMYAELDFAKYFTFRSNFGGTLDNQYYYAYEPSLYGYSSNQTNKLLEGSGYTRKWSWQNTILFSKDFHEDHSVKFLIGTEYISSYGRSLWASRVDFFSDDPNYSFLSNGAATGQDNYSQASNSAVYSIFSRLDYAYKDKYLLMGTLRRDGSSVFGSENRYSFFPSLSAAWRISKENFASGLSWMTDLKLRGSWGKLGFDGNTPLINQYTLYSGSPGTTFYDINGNSSTTTPGLRFTYIGNPKTGWQTDIQTNIGLDGTLWNGKLSFSADWYIKKSTGLLFPLSHPYYLGAAAAPYVNVGDIENKGIDLLLGSRGRFGKELRYDFTVTFTSYDNKIVKLNDGQNFFSRDMCRNEVGHPVSSFYGYKIIGFFNSQDDVAKSPVQDAASPGRFKYLDANGDHIISDADRVFLGNPNPKFSLGLNIAFTYKSFDFSAFFYGVFGNEVYNYVRLGTDFFPVAQAKTKTLLYDSWTPEHKNAKVSINESDINFSNNSVTNSYPVEDGSYFRSKSIILGYSLGRNTCQKIKMKQMRMYVQVVNLFTITSYTGLDPESVTVGDVGYTGVDAGNYPNNQIQWLFGLNIGL